MLKPPETACPIRRAGKPYTCASELLQTEKRPCPPGKGETEDRTKTINPEFLKKNKIVLKQVWESQLEKIISLIFQNHHQMMWHLNVMMKIRNHPSFEVKVPGFWADTYSNKLSKSWQWDKTPPGFLEPLCSDLCRLFSCNREPASGWVTEIHLQYQLPQQPFARDRCYGGSAPGTGVSVPQPQEKGFARAGQRKSPSGFCNCFCFNVI